MSVKLFPFYAATVVNKGIRFMWSWAGAAVDWLVVGCSRIVYYTFEVPAREYIQRGAIWWRSRRSSMMVLLTLLFWAWSHKGILQWCPFSKVVIVSLWPVMLHPSLPQPTTPAIIKKRASGLELYSSLCSVAWKSMNLRNGEGGNRMFNWNNAQVKHFSTLDGWWCRVSHFLLLNN